MAVRRVLLWCLLLIILHCFEANSCLNLDIIWLIQLPAISDNSAPYRMVKTFMTNFTNSIAMSTAQSRQGFIVFNGPFLSSSTSTIKDQVNLTESSDYFISRINSMPKPSIGSQNVQGAIEYTRTNLFSTTNSRPGISRVVILSLFKQQSSSSLTILTNTTNLVSAIRNLIQEDSISHFILFTYNNAPNTQIPKVATKTFNFNTTTDSMTPLLNQSFLCFSSSPPTASPLQPTSSPSFSLPTSSPTFSRPTHAPSKSFSTTFEPTLIPTYIPTISPLSPSVSPSFPSPSNSPYQLPTKSPTNLQTHSPTNLPTKSPVCLLPKVDIVFMVDTSSSFLLNADLINFELQFIISFIRSLQLSEEMVRVGVLNFAGRVFNAPAYKTIGFYSNFSDPISTNPSLFASTLLNLTILGGTSDIAGAFNFVRTNMMTRENFREGSSRLVVLFTDSDPTNEQGVVTPSTIATAEAAVDLIKDEDNAKVIFMKFGNSYSPGFLQGHVDKTYISRYNALDEILQAGFLCQVFSVSPTHSPSTSSPSLSKPSLSPSSSVLTISPTVPSTFSSSFPTLSPFSTLPTIAPTLTNSPSTIPTSSPTISASFSPSTTTSTSIPSSSPSMVIPTLSPTISSLFPTSNPSTSHPSASPLSTFIPSTLPSIINPTSLPTISSFSPTSALSSSPTSSPIKIPSTLSPRSTQQTPSPSTGSPSQNTVFLNEEDQANWDNFRKTYLSNFYCNNEGWACSACDDIDSLRKITCDVASASSIQEDGRELTATELRITAIKLKNSNISGFDPVNFVYLKFPYLRSIDFSNTPDAATPNEISKNCALYSDCRLPECFFPDNLPSGCSQSVPTIAIILPILFLMLLFCCCSFYVIRRRRRQKEEEQGLEKELIPEISIWDEHHDAGDHQKYWVNRSTGEFAWINQKELVKNTYNAADTTPFQLPHEIIIQEKRDLEANTPIQMPQADSPETDVFTILPKAVDSFSALKNSFTTASNVFSNAQSNNNKRDEEEEVLWYVGEDPKTGQRYWEDIETGLVVFEKPITGIIATGRMLLATGKKTRRSSGMLSGRESDLRESSIYRKSNGNSVATLSSSQANNTIVKGGDNESGNPQYSEFL